MNYYHELLESYSKLKKRSLTLIAEGDEADEKKTAARQAALKNALPLAIAAAEEGKALEPGKAITPTGIYNDKIKIEKSKTGKTLLWDGGRYSPLFTVGGISTYVEGDLLTPQKGWTKLASAFIDPAQEEGTETEEDNATQAENNKTTEEEAALKAIEANKEALNPFLEAMGIETEQVEGQEGQDEDETSDFDPAALTDVFGAPQPNGGVSIAPFTNSVSSTIEKWIKDTTVPLEAKVESARNLRDMVYLTADLSRKIKNGKILEQADINKLKDILKKIALTQEPGQREEGFILNKDNIRFDAYTVLVFGIQTGGKLEENAWKKIVIETIEKAKSQWSEATHGKDNIDDFEIIEPNAEITADTRGKADEAVMAGAGDIVSIFSLSDQIKITEDDVERERLEERRSWSISRLQTHWSEATTKLTAQQLAETLRMGLESMEGTGIDTLGSLSDKELTEALVDRLVNSYPKSFCSRKLPSGECDRGEAMAFVNTLASEPDGKRAFATFLLLRANAIQSVLGEGVTPSFSYTVGNISQSTKGKRIKKDVVYAVDSKNLESLKKHLKSMGVNITKLFQEGKTIGQLLDNKEMSVEDFPPGTFVDPENRTPEEEQQEFQMVQVSLKTQPASNDISMGGFSPITLTDSNRREETHRTTVRSQLETAGLTGKPPKPTNEEINKFYDGIDGAKGREKGKDLRDKIKDLSTDNPPLFKAVVTELFTLAGTAAQPQLNVTNELDTGQTSMESDKVYRERIQKGIGNKTLKFEYGAKSKVGGVINIVDKKGTIISKIKFNSDGKIEVIKTPEYTKKYGKKKKISENKDNLMTDFLKAQATLIQELLATH